jgi:hypothetical protein
LRNATELLKSEHILKQAVVFSTDADKTRRKWLLDNRDLIDNQLLALPCTRMLGPIFWLKIDGAAQNGASN